MQVLKKIQALFSPALVVILLFVGVTASALGSKDEKEAKPATPDAKVATGMASWYGGQFQGKKTTTGEHFDMSKMTCASNRYPMGTWLKVTNLRNGKSVLVRVNDRMHPRMRRIVDLSKGAASQIGMISSGVAKVSVEDMGNLEPRGLK